MASTTDVRVGGPATSGGYAFHAPIGSTRPTSASTTLDAAYKDLGYLSEDGVEVSTERGSEKVRDWNLDTVAVLEGANEATVTVIFMSRNPETMKLLFGEDNVETDTVDPTKIKAVHYTGETLPHEQFAFLLKDSRGPRILDFGDAQITSAGPFSYRKNGVVTYPATIELFKDASGRFYTEHGE